MYKMNLNLTNVLTKEELEILNNHGLRNLRKLTGERYEKLKKKVREIDNYLYDEADYEDEILYVGDENIALLYELSKKVDVTNPYRCYDYFSKSIPAKNATPDEIRNTMKEIIKNEEVLAIQFGYYWREKLLDEKETIRKILNKHPEIDFNNKTEMEDLLFEISLTMYESARDGEDEEGGYMKRLDYAYKAVEHYFDCNFK